MMYWYVSIRKGYSRENGRFRFLSVFLSPNPYGVFDRFLRLFGSQVAYRKTTFLSRSKEKKSSEIALTHHFQMNVTTQVHKSLIGKTTFLSRSKEKKIKL
jgi:hypothetical protein